MEISAPSANSRLSKGARGRRFVVVLVVLTVAIFGFWNSREKSVEAPEISTVLSAQVEQSELAIVALGRIAIKGRAPNNDYERDNFGAGWATIAGCDTRNRILERDLQNVVKQEGNCVVGSGTLDDPYTAKRIEFSRGEGTSSAVQIDHVVALSDAWQKGAAVLTAEQREAFANDQLNLLAVDGPTNIKKSDSDAASWLPPNKSYRCRYVARQIAVKLKYALWVTRSEYDAVARVLSTCPSQVLPVYVDGAN